LDQHRCHRFAEAHVFHGNDLQAVPHIFFHGWAGEDHLIGQQSGIFSMPSPDFLLQGGNDLVGGEAVIGLDVHPWIAI
jgi:hypothetical protein